MTDIFISYSQKDRETASRLAQALADRGYDVWWDALIRGGAQYRKEIRQAIYSCKAAIVIWSTSSASSDWVIDEAEESKRLNKLVPTHVESFSVESVPFGFRQLQTIEVSNVSAIEQSVRGFGAAPSPKLRAPSSTSVGYQAGRQSWLWSSVRRRHAFVLGNTDYRSVERFVGASDDARAIAQRLSELGFQTTVGTNLGRPEALGNLEIFTKSLGQDDIALLFYTGHGLQIDGVNYVVPVDVSFQTAAPISELVSLRAAVDAIAARVRTLLVFVDATRPIPFSKEQIKRLEDTLSEIGEGGSREALGLVEPGLSHFRVRTGIANGQCYVLFASFPGEPGHSYEDGRGLFVEALSRHIGTRGLPLEDMVDRVAQDIGNEALRMGADQEPWRETSMRDAFYFNPPTVRPMRELASLALLVGLVTSGLLFDEDAQVRDPTVSPWLWFLGLPFGLVVAYGVVRWGSGRWLHAVVAMTFATVAFAFALLVLQTRVTPGGDLPSGPIALSLDERFFLDARLVGISLLALFAGLSLTVGTALGCTPQLGSFRGFETTAGALSVGMLMPSVFIGFLILSNWLLLPPNPLIIGLGALWFSAFGAQLGYRFSIYVPEYQSTLLEGILRLVAIVGLLAVFFWPIVVLGIFFAFG